MSESVQRVVVPTRVQSRVTWYPLVSEDVDIDDPAARAELTPGDPTNVTCTVRKPDGTSHDYEYGVAAELVRVSAGVYYVEFPVTTVGRWWAVWKASSSGGPHATQQHMIVGEEAVA